MIFFARFAYLKKHPKNYDLFIYAPVTSDRCMTDINKNKAEKFKTKIRRENYLKVLSVSPWFTSAGLIVAIIIVFEFPPNESFSNQVKTESL